MKQRDLRRELGRAFHVLDGVAELAVLVGDDAEQVLGFRHVGLRLEDLAADRLRLHQLAFGAAALGVHQRLAERHKCLAGSFVVGLVDLALRHGRLD